MSDLPSPITSRSAIATVLLAVMLMAVMPCTAHSPSNVTLGYDPENQTVDVTMTHGVSDPKRHYVYMVDLTKNDLPILSESYTEQPTSSTFTYTYPVMAEVGDVIKATAHCNIAGSRSGDVTVQGTVMRTMENSLPLEQIELPPGLQIEVYASGLPYARSMTISPGGTPFVGTRLSFDDLDSGKLSGVYAIIDSNGNARAEPGEVTLLAMLENPNGVAFHDGDLYVAEIDRILRYEEIEARLDDPPEPVVVKDLPYYILHGWRYIAFGPDDLLYVTLGANCNVCEPPDELNATIVRMRPDGTDMEVYARGVRNSLGLDWDSKTGELWFTDNGRDLLGNDVPSDELNHAVVPGSDFGFPSCHSGSIPDPVFGSDLNYSCLDKVPPAWMLGPHVASLGMRFYSGVMFPEYEDFVIIAEHGSWNRDTPIGYRVVAVRVTNNTAVDHTVLAEGWLQDGSLLVSDDLNGVVYRISRS